MRAARLRLASLWLSQAARILADSLLFVFAASQVAPYTAWNPIDLSFLLPFFLLAPLIGPLVNGLPKYRVLAGSCLYSLAAMAILTAWAEGPLVWCVGLALAMIGSAIYGPTCQALLPAVAADTGNPLSRVNGWIEMGSAAALVGGLLLGAGLRQTEIFAVLLALNAVALLAGLPADFPADERRPEAVGLALRGFFRDSQRTLRNREAAACLFGLAVFLAIAWSGALAMFDPAVALWWGFAGAAVGSAVASFQGHPRRVLGLVPLGLLGATAALAWAALSGDRAGPAFCLGLTAGLAGVALRATYQAAVAADARGNAMALSNSINCLGVLLLAALLAWLRVAEVLSPAGRLWLLAALSAVGCVLAWRLLFREGFEQLLEIGFWPIHRIHGRGPGLDQLPANGPVLIVANHSAWFDPLWVGKVMRRPIYPMMISDFYDLPIVHFFFAHVFHAVRVQASSFRREAPELKNAIAVLDRGDCLTIFPEGWLRRSPEPSVRQFGQGVWHILRERPTTPVVLCWIEGGWGSYTSYFQGKPTVNKRPDFWRQIDVAVSAPIVVPDEVLADLRTTRTFLMRRCLEARGHLGLKVPELLEEEEKEKPPTNAEENG